MVSLIPASLHAPYIRRTAVVTYACLYAGINNSVRTSYLALNCSGLNIKGRYRGHKLF